MQDKHKMPAITVASRQRRSLPRSAVVTLYRDTVIYILLLGPALMVLLSGQLGQSANAVDASSFTGESSSLMIQALAIFVLVNSIIISQLFKIRLRVLLLVLSPLLGMILWIYLSSFWSDFPALTLRRALRMHIELTSVILLALSLQSREAILRCLFWSFLIISAMDLASMAAPSVSFTPIGFSGIHLHKNEAGLFFFLALPIFAIGMFDRTISGSRLLSTFAFVAAAGMLALTLSKTAVLALFLSVILVACIRVARARNFYSRVVLPLGVAIIAIAVSVTIAIADIRISDLFDVLFGNATLTGRDQIWRYALYQFESHSWAGVGFGALWQVQATGETSLKNAGVHWLAIQAHNGYIDVLAQLGCIGFAFLVLYLVITLIYLCRYSSNFETTRILSLANYALYIYWGSVLFNVTETSFFRSGHPLWVMLLLVSACATGILIRGGGAARRLLPRALVQLSGAHPVSETPSYAPR
jgi:exopolysaccharide production protein ExoQ